MSTIEVEKRKTLEDFLKEKADEAELNSLRKYSEDDYAVKIAAFHRLATKGDWMIDLLADRDEVEETENGVWLRDKPPKLK